MLACMGLHLGMIAVKLSEISLLATSSCFFCFLDSDLRYKLDKELQCTIPCMGLHLVMIAVLLNEK